MKVRCRIARRKELANKFSKMVTCTMDNGKIIRWKDKASTFSTQVMYLKDNSKKERRKG